MASTATGLLIEHAWNRVVGVTGSAPACVLYPDGTLDRDLAVRDQREREAGNVVVGHPRDEARLDLSHRRLGGSRHGAPGAQPPTATDRTPASASAAWAAASRASGTRYGEHET